MSHAARPGLRLLWIFFAFLAASVVIGGRLVFVQGMGSDRFAALAADQRERRFVLAPQRGSILDRDGAELALSVDMATVVANPHFVPDPAAAAAALAPVLGAEPRSLTAKLSRKAGFVYLARKIDGAKAEQVRQLRIPGVEVFGEAKRVYPAGRLGSHVVGFAGMDNEGLEGLERYYDTPLRGLPGELLMERDPSGRSIPMGKYHFKPPVPGDDLILTIDREIQYAAETALAGALQTYQAKGGTIIVLMPTTGEILALANLPDYDPNRPGDSPAAARKNRAVVDVYEPGSANKVITASAAIETGVIKPDDVLRVPDKFKLSTKIFKDSHPHPTVDLTFAQIIEQSSNVGTIKVAQPLGPDRLYDYLRRFGYGRPTGLDFPGESGGILPRPERWWKTSMGTIPIGQGVAVTPLQIASVYAAVANGGVAVQPRLAAAAIDAQGSRRPAPASSSRRVINEDTAAQVTRILLGVTEGQNGTGKAAAIPGYQVAGKTGTASKMRADGAGYEGYIGSFVGFAPAGEPKLVVAVVLDEPSPIWGGVTAAPTFKQVMQFCLRRLGIGPGPVLPAEGKPLPAPDRSGGVAPDPSQPAPPETLD